MAARHLLFIFTDEQRADTLGAYGNRRIQTPHLDRLATESVVFEKCYVSQPVCTPSRSTILTGLYPHTTGCISNNIPLPDVIRCLPEMVSGYRTAYFGKWHLGDEVFAQHGLQDWFSIEDAYIKYYSPGRDRNTRSTYHHWLVEKGYTPDRPMPDGPGIFSRGMAARLPEEHCKPAYLAFEFSRWLAQRPRDERFIAYINFLEPHMPFFGPRNDQYDPDKVDLPPNFNNPPGEQTHLKARVLYEHYRQGFEGHNLDSEAGWRRLIANYWGLVSQVDAAVGAILTALEAAGLAEDTIVVYTSDHGDMMGSHRLLAKGVMYEEAVSVPLLIRVPGVPPGVVSHSVSQVDLVPTLFDFLGGPRTFYVEGQSLRPLMEREESPTRRDVFIEWNELESSLENFTRDVPEEIARLGSPQRLRAAFQDPIRTVVTAEGWKLNYSPILHQHELYNLRDDPYEKQNLYGQAGTQDLVQDLETRLRTWASRTYDRIALGV